MRKWAYISALCGCLVAGTLAGWTALGVRVNNYAYDVWTRLTDIQARESEALVVAIDEETLRAKGGMRNIRTILAETLDTIHEAGPQAVALDVILSDTNDETTDARLEAAMAGINNLVLPCDITATGWENPLPRFGKYAKAIGHVHPEIDRLDGVSRALSLEEISGSDRRWALSLEAFRAARGGEIVESPNDVTLGSMVIPARRSDTETKVSGRPMRIRYIPGGIPTVSALRLASDADKLHGKTVFVGVTALSAARDRLLNPYGQNVPGVEVHAHAYETFAAGHFLKPMNEMSAFGLSLAFATAAGLAFYFLSGWKAYAAALVILLVANLAPLFAFQQNWLLPFMGPSAVAWLSCAGAATLNYFFVRQQLKTSESDKTRYQQAMQWAAHEMRTPLTAIQGSSEIMTNYSLPAAKSKELSEMINAESKRLGRLIQTFLDVERLSDGHVELKQDVFSAASLISSCLSRAQALATGKNIRVILDGAVEGELRGDHELMEYALYNLLTNAIKYSPANTTVTVFGVKQNGELRVSVRDQGMGMDTKELASIFHKFYRTKKAEG